MRAKLQRSGWVLIPFIGKTRTESKIGCLVIVLIRKHHICLHGHRYDASGLPTLSSRYQRSSSLTRGRVLIIHYTLVALSLNGSKPPENILLLPRDNSDSDHNDQEVLVNGAGDRGPTSNIGGSSLTTNLGRQTEPNIYQNCILVTVNVSGKGQYMIPSGTQLTSCFVRREVESPPGFGQYRRLHQSVFNLSPQVHLLISSTLVIVIIRFRQIISRSTWSFKIQVVATPKEDSRYPPVVSQSCSSSPKKYYQSPPNRNHSPIARAKMALYSNIHYFPFNL